MIYADKSGMVPNIGHFETGQELTDTEASMLKAAGYKIEDAARKSVKIDSGSTNKAEGE